MPTIQIESDPVRLAQKACDLIVQAATFAIKEKSFFTLVLSGGKTPILTYEKLALCDLPWNQIHLFWGDERHVPPDSPKSNFRLAHEHLISKILIPQKNIHRVQSELSDSKIVAKLYAEDIRSFFLEQGQKLPVFDLILLGMGDDGHTASLFPGVIYPQKSEEWVSSLWINKLKTFRITLLPQILNQGASILVLIVGIEKSVVIKSILNGNETAKDFPILEIHPTNGKVLWLLDKSAASQI